MYQRRVVGLVLVCAAAVLTLAAVGTRTWWTLRDGPQTISVGLRDAQVCEDRPRRYYDYAPEAAGSGRCAAESLRRFVSRETDGRRTAPRTFVFLGTLVLVSGLAAIGALIALAATQLGGRRPRVLPSISALAWGAFAALALAFVVAAPAELRELRAGLGPMFALVGAVCGVAASFVLARHDAAREPLAATLRAADDAAITSRVPGLIAGAVGCALVLVSLFTHAWFGGRDDQRRLGIGVQEVSICGERWGDDDAAGCTVRTIPASVEDARDPGRMRTFLAAGTLTGWSGLAAVITFAIVALLVLLRQAVPPPVSLGRVVSAAAIVFCACGLGYLLSRPREAVEVSMSYGAMLGLGGGGALLGAGILLGRWIDAVRAVAPSIPAPPTEELAGVPVPVAMAAGMAGVAPPPGLATPVPITIPACPRCGTPMLWVSARQAWFCTVCKGKDDDDR
jgi:hypothetical protein